MAVEKLFGTDGIRGVANRHPMTVEVAAQVGRALSFLLREGEDRRHRIVIGKDTRLSCYMLENALAAGISSMGVDVLQVGPLPTPGIAFITTSMRADAGVVISASHNPYHDNGIKIFSRDGFKLPDALEQKIEQLLSAGELGEHVPQPAAIGRAKRIEDAAGRYIVFLKHTFPKELTLDGLHIVLDCANGAAYRVAPHVFEELGARVTKLGVTPDGTNINQECGALYPQQVASVVKEKGADIGLALDGDADRLIVCDEKGNIVDGDHIMAICAQEMLVKEELRKKTLVATVMSNLGLEVAMERMGGKLVRSAVGDRSVVEMMRSGGYSFGGEQSGHLVFLDHITTGDGTLAALQLLAIMQQRQQPLSSLAEIMESFPQVLKNVRTSRRVEVASIAGFTAAVERLEKELGKRGRILVRPSGTEPVIRVMVEGEDSQHIEQVADELCALIDSAAGCKA